MKRRWYAYASRLQHMSKLRSLNALNAERAYRKTCAPRNMPVRLDIPTNSSRVAESGVEISDLTGSALWLGQGEKLVVRFITVLGLLGRSVAAPPARSLHILARPAVL